MNVIINNRLEQPITVTLRDGGGGIQEHVIPTRGKLATTKPQLTPYTETLAQYGHLRIDPA